MQYEMMSSRFDTVSGGFYENINYKWLENAPSIWKLTEKNGRKTGAYAWYETNELEWKVLGEMAMLTDVEPRRWCDDHHSIIK